MADRFFVDGGIQGDSALLVGAEAHHLLHVMRGKVGDLVKLFDGGGLEYLAQISKRGRREVELAVIQADPVDRESTLRLTLAVAMPPGDRQHWLVEKSVELGVTRVVPLITQRSGTVTESSLARLRRGVVEASKQCGRNRLMEIAPACPWSEFVAMNRAATRIIAAIGAAQLDAVFGETNKCVEAVVAVGPVGDWTPEELDLAETHHWLAVGLGPRILRVETAALLLAVVLTQVVAAEPT